MKRTNTFLFLFFQLIQVSFLEAQTFTQFINSLKSTALEIILYENKTKI